MKTLLQIGAALNCGAPGKIAEQIGLLAMSKGWDVFMAHGHRHSNPSKLKTIPMVTPSSEKVHALYSLLLDKHGLGPDGRTKDLVEWIKEHRPDVIHLHNIHGHFLNFQTLFKFLCTTDIPVVWTFHDFWPITGHCAYFDHINCEKWKMSCSECPQKGAYPRSLFVDRSFANYTLKKELFSSVRRMVLVPVSKWAGSLLQESFLGEYPIQTIYNGIDTSIFKPTECGMKKALGLESKKILVGVASPWSARKGYRDYFRLREILPEEYAIIMVGLNKKEMKEIPKGIIGVTRTQNQVELAEYYSMADVVLNLSYQETFGMTTVEGMACGTPVIVYNNTACPELVTDDTGIVVTPGDVCGVKAAIETIVQGDMSRYKIECRKRAVENFDKEKCFMQYIDLYNSLL